MNRLTVNGAQGRMGSRICALAKTDQRFTLVAQIDRVGDQPQSLQLQRAHDEGCDVVIDFSSDEGALTAVELAQRCGAALLVGTTGLTAKTTEKIGLCADRVPVMIAPNTSRGVAVLCHLIAQAAALLGSAYDIDIVDVHHRAKRDAPSGTALRLVDSLREGAGVHVRDERIHSLRAGDVVGDHEVSYAGPGERIKISHSATSRDVFALGALDAAAWLRQQPAGMYRIEQSLGLNA